MSVIAVLAATASRRMQQALTEAQVAAARSEVVEIQADTDAMTGLLNRRGLTKRILENNHPERSIAILDCDRLKTINDTYGHVVGDEYIIAIANRLANGISEQDYIARWGGDEFLIIINAPTQGAQLVLNRLVSKIAESPISTIVGSISASVTGGLTNWNAAESLDDSLRRADESLYQAKANGGGTIFVG